METSNAYQKHLNLSKRIIIEKMLDQGSNFKTIAEVLGKSNRTISYEILKHREKKPGLKITNKTFTHCPKTDKPPYVCNGCLIRIGMELFHRYFEVILTDNGGEFSNPYDIENNGPDVLKSHVFYCDPKQSQQKGKIEVAHEYIRKYIPKSTSFNNYAQGDINIMINHINNTVREKLVKEYGDLYDTPFKLHKTRVEEKFFNVFDLYYIDSKNIILNKKIFKKDN